MTTQDTLDTHLITRRTALQGLLAGASAGFSSLALAQSTRTTQLIVGFPAGGGIDLLARVAADSLRTPQDNIVVDNRAGVAGRLALEYVKQQAPADGSTLLLTPDFPLTIFPHLYKKLPYAPQADFAPVAGCAKSPLALSVGPMVPAAVQTVEQFVHWCKANQKEAAFASSGPGGILHLLGVQFNQATGAAMTHVPFKGSAPALQALVGGQIPASFNAVGEALPFASTGKLRTLATFGTARSRFMPEVPSIAEAGMPGLVAETWLGIFASAKTPPDKLQQWTSRVTAAVASPKFQEAAHKLSLEPFAASPATLAQLVKTDIARWGPVVAASGFKAEE